MHVIRVELHAEGTNKRALVDNLLAESIDVRRTFPGCRRFDVLVDPVDESKVLLLEEWEDAASFAAYQESGIFEHAGAVSFPLIDGSPDSAYYAAELVGP